MCRKNPVNTERAEELQFARFCINSILEQYQQYFNWQVAKLCPCKSPFIESAENLSGPEKLLKLQSASVPKNCESFTMISRCKSANLLQNFMPGKNLGFWDTQEIVAPEIDPKSFPEVSRNAREDTFQNTHQKCFFENNTVKRKTTECPSKKKKSQQKTFVPGICDRLSFIIVFDEGERIFYEISPVGLMMSRGYRSFRVWTPSWTAWLAHGLDLMW